MKTVWDDFWIEKGKSMEWSQNDVLYSKGLDELSGKILRGLKKTSLKEISVLELGAGMGITSLYFGSKGAKVSLLDLSKEAKPLAKEYWGKYAKHNFIIADLFTFKSKEKYDVVSSFGLCEHFVGEQRIEVLQRHIDFLKDKGIAVISVPYRYGIFYRAAKKLAEMTGYWGFGLEVPFSKKELINFANNNKLGYEIIMNGFYSSAYDLIVRKPLKVFRISVKRRFDGTKSIFDRIFGSGLMIILKKNSKK